MLIMTNGATARLMLVSTRSQFIGGIGEPINQNGFFDHFPTTMTVPEGD
jgi:hypothetical protein